MHIHTHKPLCYSHFSSWSFMAFLYLTPALSFPPLYILCSHLTHDYLVQTRCNLSFCSGTTGASQSVCVPISTHWDLTFPPQGNDLGLQSVCAINFVWVFLIHLQIQVIWKQSALENTSEVGNTIQSKFTVQQLTLSCFWKLVQNQVSTNSSAVLR